MKSEREKENQIPMNKSRGEGKIINNKDESGFL